MYQQHNLQSMVYSNNYCANMKSAELGGAGFISTSAPITKSSKQRREMINQEIDYIRTLLPLHNKSSQRLSQLEVMSMACIFIRRCHILGSEITQDQSYSDIIKAVPGFILVCTTDGKLVYISDNITDFLGHSMVDITKQGDNVYDIVDPKDHEVVKQALGDGSTDEVNIRCRIALSRYTRRQSSFFDEKPVQMSGYLTSSTAEGISGSGQRVLIALCTPVLSPAIKPTTVSRTLTSFTSVHSLDMKFVEASPICSYYLGYEEDELIGRSWFEFVSPQTLQTASERHKEGTGNRLLRYMQSPFIVTKLECCVFALTGFPVIAVVPVKTRDCENVTFQIVTLLSLCLATEERSDSSSVFYGDFINRIGSVLPVAVCLQSHTEADGDRYIISTVQLLKKTLSSSNRSAEASPISAPSQYCSSPGTENLSTGDQHQVSPPSSLYGSSDAYARSESLTSQPSPQDKQDTSVIPSFPQPSFYPSLVDMSPFQCTAPMQPADLFAYNWPEDYPQQYHYDPCGYNGFTANNKTDTNIQATSQGQYCRVPQNNQGQRGSFCPWNNQTPSPVQYTDLTNYSLERRQNMHEFSHNNGQMGKVASQHELISTWMALSASDHLSSLGPSGLPSKQHTHDAANSGYDNEM